MEVKYYKEQTRNYMSIYKENMDNNVLYQEKMLLSKKIKHLLGFSSRFVDGSIYHFYDITSKISLEQLYGSREIRKEDIFLLISNLHDACDEVDKYLLDDERIILNPKYIFFSYTKNEYSFLYNISTSEQKSGMNELLDFFLVKTNSDDSEAMELVYKMYEQYEQGNYTVWDMILTVSENDVSNEKNAAYDVKMDDILLSEKSTVNEISSSENKLLDYRNMTNRDYSITTDLKDDEKDKSSVGIRNASQAKKNTLIVPAVLMVIGILGLVVMIIINFNLIVTDEEKIILLSAACASGLIFLIGIFLFIYNLISAKRIIKDDENIRHYMEDELAALDYGELKPIPMETIMPKPVHRINSSPIASKETVQVDDEGQTVFFDVKNECGDYKLYSIDKKNKKHISLDKFPYTIGKMTEYVDCCLEHPSISRVHARFDYKDQNLMVSDLNSTNGVYINGIRLNPNETRMIEIGDEIRIGSLNYCLRYT